MKYMIYKHTSPDGKSYIGQTTNYCKRSDEHRNSYTNPFFLEAINKYGWDNFTHEILIYVLTREDANILEAMYINKYNSLHPNGYNLKKSSTAGNKENPEIERDITSDRSRINGASLAAMRTNVTHICPVCGETFTAIRIAKACKKCSPRARYLRQKAKKQKDK